MNAGEPTPLRNEPPAASAAEIEAAAADWFVRRQAGFAPGEDARFQAWLSSDARCRQALAELEAAWAAISYPAEAGQSAAAHRDLKALRRAKRRRRRQIGFLGLAAAAAFAVAAFVSRPPRDGQSAEVATVTVRPDRLVLPDGSTVERNARTDIEVAFSAGERRVRLLRGEALFSVMHDAARPFFVVSAGVEVRAVGTEFSVRYDPSQVNVLVTEGRVTVARLPAAEEPARPAPAAAPAVPVDAGTRIVLPIDAPRSVAPAITPVPPAEIAAALAWRGKRIEFTRTPLAEAVELFNRQNRLQLSLGDAATGRIRVTGLYWADDPESFARLLASGFNVATERAGDVIHLRQP